MTKNLINFQFSGKLDTIDNWEKDTSSPIWVKTTVLSQPNQKRTLLSAKGHFCQPKDTSVIRTFSMNWKGQFCLSKRQSCPLWIVDLKICTMQQLLHFLFFTFCLFGKIYLNVTLIIWNIILRSRWLDWYVNGSFLINDHYDPHL